MKYVIRHGVFETNSSSTHSMVLLIKGTDNEVAVRKKMLEGDDLLDEHLDLRTISSPLMKALILFQFYFVYIGQYTLAYPDEEEDYLNDLDNCDRASYFEDKEKIASFKKKVFARFTSKEDLKRIGRLCKELEESFRGYMPMCNECFLNDVLIDCTCKMDYESICKSLDIDPKEENAEDKVIEKIFDENVYFLIGENWLGGYYDKDFPTDF